MNIKGQSHSMTFIQGHSDSKYSNFVSLETARPIEAKFHMGSPWNKIIKGNTNGLCHMTKVADISIYGKTFKSLFVWNQKVDYLETWYAALVSRVLPHLFK